MNERVARLETAMQSAQAAYTEALDAVIGTEANDAALIDRLDSAYDEVVKAAQSHERERTIAEVVQALYAAQPNDIEYHLFYGRDDEALRLFLGEIGVRLDDSAA